MSVSRRDLFKIAAPAALIIPCASFASNTQNINSSSGKLDVFIVYGQSNALGLAGIDEHFDESNLVKINKGSYYYFGGEIRPLVHYMPSVNTGISSGSAWSQFSNTYRQITGRSCVFVQAARGSTKLEDLIPPSNNYERMIAAAKDTLSILGDNFSGKIYCVFHQGEADQFNGTGKEKYQKMLISLVEGMKKDINLDRFYLFKVSAPHGRSEEDIVAIQSAQDDICEKEEMVVMAFSGCPAFNRENLLLGSDEVHYSLYGYNIMGQIGAENIAKSIETKTTITKDDLDKYGFLSMNPDRDWRMISASFTFTSDDGLKMFSNYYPKNNSGKYALSNVIGYEVDGSNIKIRPSFPIQKILSEIATIKVMDRSFSARIEITSDKENGILLSAFGDMSFDIKIGEETLYRPFTDNEYFELADLINIKTDKKTGEITISHPSAGMTPNVLISQQGMYNKALGYDISIISDSEFKIKPFVKQPDTKIRINLLNCAVPIGCMKFQDMIISAQVIGA